ncbi:MAG: adenine phosphoribosyltransferase [Halobacteriovoraceae bacterium]|nr:adenine phosphoribosyltransferase [Peredibacter sp.]MBJ01127.1 adenine phosphoribosyltransferase [Halobacteriovoraceae bacterium]
MEKYISNVPDFPKKGVMFKDFSPLLEEKLPECLEAMGKNIPWDQIDCVVGIESRGFILGSALAAKHDKGFILVRKKGKLPPPVSSESYSLEYGEDTLEMKPNTKEKSVLIVDDVLATGGTLKATISLCEKNNYHVKAISMLINLKFLNNLASEVDNIHSVLDYE